MCCMADRHRTCKVLQVMWYFVEFSLFFYCTLVPFSRYIYVHWMEINRKKSIVTALSYVVFFFLIKTKISDKRRDIRCRMFDPSRLELMSPTKHALNSFSSYQSPHELAYSNSISKNQVLYV